MKKTEIKKIVKEISKLKSVKAIYLFGSYVSKKNNPMSDIDVCIIGDLEKKEKMKILRNSSEIFDISFFNELPIYIKFRVFKYGEPLFIRSLEEINDIKLSTLKEYLDFKPLINKLIEKNIIK